MIYSAAIPSWFIKLNPSLVWKIPTTKNELFLTFDDGPHETATPFVLDQLKTYNVKATFFCLGKNVKAHPKIYERIVDEGHAVGNHTFNHLNGWKVKNSAYVKDILAAEKYIDSKLFRPPYGKISPFVYKQLCNQLHFKIIMWHILSGDFDEKINAQTCIENVLFNAKPGSIIVFHDSTKAWPRMKIALPKILQHYSNKEYIFKTLN